MTESVVDAAIPRGEIRDIRPCEPQARSDIYQFSERISLHFAHHVSTMRFHRDLADAELAANLFVRKAGDHECKHFAFARGETGIA